MEQYLYKELSYFLRINKKAKNIIVKLVNGKIVITTPIYNKKAIERVLEKNYCQILSLSEKYRVTETDQITVFPLFGKQWQIKENAIEYPDFLNQILFVKKLNHQDVIATIINLYKKVILTYLAETLPQISKKMNLQYSKYQVRLTYRQWGSCSCKNALSFSLLLAMFDYSIIDYIIVHELSHIKYRNHSKEFWDLVTFYVADLKKIKSDLHAKTKQLNALYPFLFGKIA